MNWLFKIFHVCNFNNKVAPMTYQCKCGRKRWGLYEEKN